MQMRLHPELVTALAGAPDLDPGDPTQARAETARLWALATGGTPASDERVRFSDQDIPGPPNQPDIRVRVYHPTTSAGPTACVVFCHGGGFVVGNLESAHAVCMSYCAEAECSVVSVDYRLAPEHPYPAAPEDCYAALCYTHDHADSLGIDPTRIAVAGASAGAALAAALTLMARDRKGPPIAFQLLVNPVLDDRMTTSSMEVFTDTPVWNSGKCVVMWRQYLGDGNSDGGEPYAAPARAADFANLPPAYIATAEYDPLRDEGLAYAQSLLGAGVPVELHLWPGTCHGFGAVGWHTSIGRIAREEQIRAFRDAIG